MPDPLPFDVSSEVERWLMEIPLLPDKQPGISYSPRFRVYDREEVREEFLEDHYVIAHATSDAWQSLSAVQIVIGGRAFWIEPETVDKIRGKKLSVIRIDVSRRDVPKMREFVVAR